MKNMISKELFSAVTGIKLGTYYFDNMETQERLWLDDTQSTHYICWDNMSNTCEINIYELAHKCKQWAKDNSYYVYTGYSEYYNCYIATVNNRHDDWNLFDYISKCKTEPEAIFKACQWILDNKEASK